MENHVQLCLAIKSLKQTTENDFMFEHIDSIKCC